MGESDSNSRNFFRFWHGLLCNRTFSGSRSLSGLRQLLDLHLDVVSFRSRVAESERAFQRLARILHAPKFFEQRPFDAEKVEVMASAAAGP